MQLTEVFINDNYLEVFDIYPEKHYEIDIAGDIMS